MTTPSWKNKPLSPTPRGWALEARLMFDAAAAVDAVRQTDAEPHDVDAHVADAPTAPAATPLFVPPADALSAPAAEALGTAVQSASDQVRAFLQQPDALDKLFTLFNGGDSAPTQAWRDAFADLQQQAAHGWQIELRLLSSAQINGAMAAFSAEGPAGTPVIFINADWLANGASSTALARVLIEEAGHAIDARINGDRDTPGDEGEAFAATVLNFDLSDAERQRVAAEDDRNLVTIDGRTVQVEEASITFPQIFKGTPASNSEEASGILTDATPITGTNFRFTSGNPSDLYFSGNNVTGTVSYMVNGVTQTITGVASRLIKSGSTVNGVYFYVPGADGLIGTGDDSAYVLGVNPAFNFTGNTYYGTSSDPVDTALNKLIVPNSAPVGVNDAATVLEDGSVTGNVLSNDSDANSDTLIVTAFKIGTTTYTVASGSSATAVMGGVGSLQISSSGAYTFTPVANYSGAVPVVTYTVSDGAATSTATLTLTITPVNDAPAGTDRTVTTLEDTPYTFAPGDFGFTDPNDSPANTLQSVVITTLPSAGTLRLNGVAVTAGQEITAANLGLLTYTPGTNGNGNAYSSFTFQVRDNGGTANGGVNLDASPNTITFNVTAVNDAPTAVADTAIATEAGGTNNGTAGTNPSGNLLTNDTDPDAGDTLTVSSVANSAGAASTPATSSTSTTNPSTVTGLYGSLAVGANGSYIYTVNNNNAAVQALRTTSNTLTETFTYTVRDASGATSSSTLTVTIRGANDAPVAVADRGNAKEAGPTPATYPGSDATGNVLGNDTDVDSGDTKTLTSLIASATAAATGSSSSTTLTVASAGTPGNTSGIDVGDVLHVTSNSVVIYDKNPSNSADRVTVTAISGTTITLSSSVTIPSGSTIQFWVPNPGGQINGSNYFSTTGGSNTGASSSTVSLSGISGTVLVGMTVSGTGLGTAPTVTAVNYSTNVVTLSSAVTLSSSTALTFSIAPGTSIQGQRGTLNIAADGSYTYHITDNSLSAGQTATETFTYLTQDAGGLTSSAVLTITIEGTSNDTEPDAKADAVTAVEAGGTSNGTAGTNPSGNVITGTGASGNEADTGASVTVTRVWSESTATVPTSSNVTGGTTSSNGTSVAGRYGTLVIGADGSYVYTVDNSLTAVQALRTSSNTLTEVFFYRIENGSGSDVTTLTVTIQGANDAPVATVDVATAQASGGVTAAFNPSGNVLANDSDVDSGDSLSVVNVIAGNAAPTTAVAGGSTSTSNATSVTGSYGTLAIGADGSYSYTVDSSNASVRSLAAGATLTDTFTYQVRDTAGLTSDATLTVTVRGANDAPVNTLPGPHTQFDYETGTISGLSVADVDGNLATVSLTVRSGTLAVTGSTGGVSGNGSASMTITDTQTNINTLLATLAYTPAGGFSGADTLTMVSTDASGLTDTDTLAITVSPDNRALTVSSPTVNEASPTIVFTVSGAAGQLVTLALGVTGSGAGHAGSGTDFSPNLEIYNGSAWVAYSGGAVALPGSGSLLVRTAVLQDMTDEGDETLTLTATNVAGGSATGTGTISDHGSGDVLLDDGNDDPTAVRDDDRPFTVTGTTVNEASPYAVFKVSGAVGQVVDLALRNGTASDADHGTSLQVYDTTAGAWVAYAPGMVVPAGGELFVRTTITNDTVAEGAESYGLVATNTGGGQAIGTTVIVDDGTGDVFLAAQTTDTPSSSGDAGYPAALDDDRALSISSPTVNEASPYILFSVTGASGQLVSLVLDTTGSGTVTLGTDTANAGTGVPLQVFDGTAWVDYSPASLVAIPAGGTTLLVRTAITQDTANEGAETMRLTASNTGGTSYSGTGTIIDNATGDIFLAGNTTGTANVPGDTGYPVLDDDRAVTVSSPSVNEASPYAVFTVTGTAGQSVNLLLSPGTASGSGTDFGASGSANLQFSLDNGASWSNYSTAVTLPAGGSILVRTPIVNDTIADDGETFTLTATPVGGHAATGTATIKDDGTGTYYNPDGTPDPSATKDDDRAVSVSSPTVNEASPYAVFTVTGTSGQSVNLVLSDGTATGSGTDFGAGNATNLQVSLDNGSSWANYSAAVTIPAGGSILVRTPIVNDTIADNGETFTLTATPIGGQAATGTATIKDDGTGTYYNPDGTPNPAAVKDDDRTLSVSSPTVNEASPYAVFTVTGTAGQNVNLLLSPGTATGSGTDFGASGSANLQFSLDNGASWFNYSTAVTLPAGGSILVRTPIVNDTIADDGETFTLTATPVGGHAATGTATIKDDGTGTLYNPDGTPNPAAVKDDDRTLSVSSPTVNEASPYAVFTVTGATGQTVSLTLTAGTASAAGVDFGSTGATALQVSIDGGTSWSNYSGAITLPAGSGILVRTPIVNDTIADDGETFTLTATPAGGQAATGTATIKDDGTGTYYNPDGNPNPAALKDDDRPLAVTSATVNEASPYVVFTVTGSAGQQARLGTIDGTADGADYGGTGTTPQLEILSNGQWIAYTTGQWIAVGNDGRLLVRTAITSDTIDEGLHSFRLRAEGTGGQTADGTATIDDHGAGGVFLATNTTGLPNAPGDNGYPQRLDDDRPPQTPVTSQPAPIPPAPPADPVVDAAPVPASQPQRFDSALAIPASLVDVAHPAALPIEVRTDVPNRIEAPRDIGDIYTRQSGFRTMVTPASEPNLQVFRGVEDQVVPAGKVLNLQVPADAFVHTDAGETVTLVAMLADGRPLPAWLHFDGKAGTFSGEPPVGEEIDLRIKITALDTKSREATVMFRIKSGERGAPGARTGFSTQLMRGEALARAARSGEWLAAKRPAGPHG